MSSSRKRWHKTNHDRRIRDLGVSNLPFRARGVLSVIEDYVGSTGEGFMSGVLHAENGCRYKVNEYVQLMAHGDAAIEKEIQADLVLLVKARQVCPRLFKQGYIKLFCWESDQELAASDNGDFKRGAEDKKLLGAAEKWGGELERLSDQLGGRRSFTDGELISYIKSRRNGYAKTNARFLECLIECGLCVRTADGMVALAALAPDRPAGVGFSGAGSGGFQKTAQGGVAESCKSPCAGIGSEISAEVKFHQIQKQNTESEERHTSFQLDSAGGGGSGASAAPGRSIGRPGSPAGDSFPPEPERSGGGGLFMEPGDAYRCHDPLRASIDFLSQFPGWANQRYGDRPCSAAVLRAEWRELRGRIGPEETERIWRTCLDAAITDKLDRQTWRTYAGMFLSRVRRQVDVLEVRDDLQG